MRCGQAGQGAERRGQIHSLEKKTIIPFLFVYYFRSGKVRLFWVLGNPVGLGPPAGVRHRNKLYFSLLLIYFKNNQGLLLITSTLSENTVISMYRQQMLIFYLIVYLMVIMN